MKFEVGEICEVLDAIGGNKWVDCEIIAIGNPYGMDDVRGNDHADYTIYDSSRLNPQNDKGYWVADKKYLRKKRPPIEGCSDEDWEDIKRLIGLPVLVPLSKQGVT